MSEAKRRALALANNNIAENAGWGRELLATELPELADILIVEGLDVSITGFTPVLVGNSDLANLERIGRFSWPMIQLLRLLCGALIGLLRSSGRREAEILVLRHQINVLRRAPVGCIAL